MTWNVPAPDPVLARVAELWAEPTKSRLHFVDAVDEHPRLRALLLELGSRDAGSPVGSTDEALAHIGLQTTGLLTLTLAIVDGIEAELPEAFTPTRLRTALLRRACIVSSVARQAGYDDPAEAFAVGMLQDVGRGLLAIQFPEHSERLLDTFNNPIEAVIRSELAFTGQSHVDAFDAAAEQWGLPPHVVEAIVGHHSHDDHSKRRVRRLQELCRVAETVVDTLRPSDTSEAVVNACVALETLASRTPVELPWLLDAHKTDSALFAEALGIALLPQPTSEEILQPDDEDKPGDTNKQLRAALEHSLAARASLERRLADAEAQLQRIADTDPLTGVYTHAYFRVRMQNALASMARRGEQTALLLVDIDNLKSINDKYGHAAGDDVLKEVARRLSESLRAEDVVGRIGGEEFAVLLPDCDPQDGLRVAQRIRLAIRDSAVACRDGQELPVTASVGGCAVAHANTIIESMRQAEKALWSSKHHGRDQVTWAA